MSELPQKQEQDLTSTVQEMTAQMAQMWAELENLKRRTLSLPQLEEPTSQTLAATVTTTRRKAIKRLGLALLGGATAATLLDGVTAQAKILANPATGSVSKIGMIAVPPGAANPVGTAPTDDSNPYYYGLVACGDISAFNRSTLPAENIGVYGAGTSTGISGKGSIFGVNGQGGLYGVKGDGTDIGVFGSSSKTGVEGTGQLGGLFYSKGNIFNALPTSTYIGVMGVANELYSLSDFSNNYTIGVYGNAPIGTNSYAGYFEGNVRVNATLSKGAGSFKIDHPLDPANKYLYHFFVESPDMMNIYNGILTLDEQGEAVVEMPDWFEALNSDFRYQLTSIGAASPNLNIAQKIQDHRFKIAGGQPDQEVSWQVTGIRQDAFAKAHRIPVEEDKPEDDKGKYLHPELFGQPKEMAVNILGRSGSK